MEISRFVNFKDKLLHVCGSVFLLTFIGYLLHWLGYLIYLNREAPLLKPIVNSPEVIEVVIFLTYLIVLYFIVKATLKRAIIAFYYAKNKVYRFRSDDWPKKWIFSGNPELVASSDLFIKSSRAGCLLKSHYWKDFRMTFEMQFVIGLDEKFGIVFRADDLDNYFMLELSRKDREIRPHVRYHGGWDVIYPNSQTAVFDRKKYINIIFEVKDTVVFLYVNGHLEFTWMLPSHVDVMYRESGSKEKEKSETDEKYVQEIPFRNRFGMVGFRAHPGQGVTIRGLTIKPL